MGSKSQRDVLRWEISQLCISPGRTCPRAAYSYQYPVLGKRERCETKM